MTRTRYRFLGNDAPYFLAMTINNWLPVFTRPATVAVLFDSWPGPAGADPGGHRLAAVLRTRFGRESHLGGSRFVG